MFITLLIVDFAVAFAVSLAVAKIFESSISKILQRLVVEEIYTAWSRYILFALYVVGISGGVRVWELERYVTPSAAPSARGAQEVLQLTPERWTLEIYRTVIGTLQSVATMLLVFFVFTLIAFVIMRGMELRRQPKS